MSERTAAPDAIPANIEALIEAFNEAIGDIYVYGLVGDERPYYVRRKADARAALVAAIAELVREVAVANCKANVLDSYATSRLCSDHRDKWQRGTCVMCDLSALRSELDACKRDAGIYGALTPLANRAAQVLVSLSRRLKCNCMAMAGYKYSCEGCRALNLAERITFLQREGYDPNAALASDTQGERG